MKWSRSLFAERQTRLDRRTLLGLAGYTAALFFTPSVITPASAALLQRVAVRVDLEGVGAIAAHIRRRLPGHLSRELARHPIDGVPSGARLLVRVSEIHLGSGEGGFGGLTDSDALEGEAILLDAKGRVLSTRRVSARVAPSGSIVTAPQDEPYRVEALMETFAYWAVRAVN